MEWTSNGPRSNLESGLVPGGRSLSYFFAYWELPGLGWRHPIIPDAVFSLRNHTFALEFDRGQENIQYFLKTKIGAYQAGLDGFPVTALLIVTEQKSRMISLARAIPNEHGRVLFSTIDLVRFHGIRGPVFFREPNGPRVVLV